jgi:transcriptional antiterminator RfaH
MRWFALSVKPQHEKTVAERLAAKSLDAYLPLYREQRRWSDRTKTLELPLFSRYVFCRFSYKERLKVLGTPSVQRIVGFGSDPAPIRDEEIERLKSMAGSGLPLAPWPYLSAGSRVRIDSGHGTRQVRPILRDQADIFRSPAHLRGGGTPTNTKPKPPFLAPGW